jgi:ceramide synthetase
VTTLGADTDRAQKKLTKFKESAWKCVYYSAAEIFALAITYNEPWFTDSKMFWLGSGEQRWPNLMTRFGDLTFLDVLIFQSDNEVPFLEELGVLTL